MPEEAGRLEVDAGVLGRVAEECAGPAGEALAGLVERGSKLAAEGVESLAREELIDGDDPLVDLSCWIQGADAGLDVHVLVEREDALRLALLQQGEDPAGAAEAPFDAERCAAFQAASRGLTDALGEALEAAGVGALEARDAREVPEPLSDPGWLIGSRFTALSFSLEIEGLEAFRIAVLLPDGGDSELLAHRNLFFLSDAQTLPEQLEELAGELGWELAPLELATLLGETAAEELAEATALVIPWQVDGRAGLELAEALRSRSETAALPLLMASHAPSRAMVMAALDAGVESFVTRPYRAEELAQRLTQIFGSRAFPSRAAAEAAPADGEGEAEGASDADAAGDAESEEGSA